MATDANVAEGLCRADSEKGRRDLRLLVVERVAPAQAREASEVRVVGVQVRLILDRQRGEMEIGGELGLGLRHQIHHFIRGEGGPALRDLTPERVHEILEEEEVDRALERTPRSR